MDSIGTAILRAFAPPDGEGYGLEVIERVKRNTRGDLLLHQGNLYPWLRLLERDGLLRSWDGEATPERGGRAKRFYELTPVGWDVVRPLRRAIDPRSPEPIGRAPIIIDKAVMPMTPPSRTRPRLAPTKEPKKDSNVIALFKTRSRRVQA